MKFTPETAAETAKGNARLSECCLAGGQQLVHVKKMLVVKSTVLIAPASNTGTKIKIGSKPERMPL